MSSVLQQRGVPGAEDARACAGGAHLLSRLCPCFQNWCAHKMEL